MCGIAGIWGSVSPERLQRMAQSLRHRGPDHEGFWTSKRRTIGLAHCRLSIIDPETGHQPMTNEDGSVVTVFNGAIYNYRELRDELAGRGHQLRTGSDTEVIVHLYEDEGPAFVQRLRGMFAIALWDQSREQLLLLRDRAGKKPLYYLESGDEFLFASEIKGLEAVRDGGFTMDAQSLVDYLGWGAVHAPATIYREVRSLTPGECIEVKARKVSKKWHYWRLALSPKIHISRPEAVERIDRELREAVRLRLRADVPVGCFLSGGIDSGVIAAIAAQNLSDRLTTLTIGFEHDAFDESPLARLVARRYGTEHHEVRIKPDVAGDLPAIARAYDQPFGDASAIPSYYVAKAARKTLKVVLSGDGGDELFAGYRRYVAGRLTDMIPGANSRLFRNGCNALARLMPTPGRFRTRYAFIHRLVRGWGLAPDARHLAWTVDGFDADQLNALRGDGADCDAMLGIAHAKPARRLARRCLDQWASAGAVDQMLACDFETVLPHDLLVKMDIATMAHGLETRSPLLDQELVEAVSRFPESLKLGGFTTKPLLRELSRKYLPDEIRRAPKRGFEVPLVDWLRDDLRELRDDVILSRNGLLSELFDRPALENLVLNRNGLDPGRWSRRVWHLLMLGLWDTVVRRSRETTIIHASCDLMTDGGTSDR